MISFSLTCMNSQTLIRKFMVRGGIVRVALAKGFIKEGGRGKVKGRAAANGNAEVLGSELPDCLLVEEGR
jgi:hypothetical protein